MAQYVDAFTVSAPGRVCILGEHQRHLGLPAIAMAVDLRATITADSIDPVELQVDTGTGRADLVIVPGRDDPCKAEHELFVRAVSLLSERGITFAKGYRFRVASQIPPACGLGDATAGVVAWIVALLRASSQLQSYTGNDIGRMGYEVEQAMLGQSACTIDSYVCSLGGKLQASGASPSQAFPIVGADLGGLVIAYPSGPTAETHAANLPMGRIEAAVDALNEVIPGFDPATTPFDDAVAQLHRVSDEHAGLLYALLRGRGLCEQTAALLRKRGFDRDGMGEAMDEDHTLIRDYLGLTTPEGENAVRVAKAAGALGASCCGPGYAVLAYAPDRQEEVVKAIEATGWKARAVSQADGARLDAGTLAPPWAGAD